LAPQRRRDPTNSFTLLIEINDRSAPLPIVCGRREGDGMNRRPVKARVKAIFRDSILQFEIAAGTTLESLCSLLALWGQGHGEAVCVEVAWQPRRAEIAPRSSVETGGQNRAASEGFWRASDGAACCRRRKRRQEAIRD